MIETVMLIALGFTLASLLALFVAPAVWRRAVRLTTRKLEATLPISLRDINADKDLLRAESAVEIRALELALEQARERAARHLMERNLYAVKIGKLESGIASLRNDVLGKTRAGKLLEQAVQKRVPRLEAQLGEADRLIAAREDELAARARTIGNQNDGLDLAGKMIRRQEQEIDRLRTALESGAGGRGKSLFTRGNDDKDRAGLVKKIGALEAKLSRLREEHDRLTQTDMADAAELRSEMHRLADLMLGGSTLTQPETSKEKPEKDPPDKTAPDEAARASAKQENAPEKKKIPATTPRRATRDASPHKSLSQRLAGFRGKKQKQTA